MLNTSRWHLKTLKIEIKDKKFDKKIAIIISKNKKNLTTLNNSSQHVTTLEEAITIINKTITYKHITLIPTPKTTIINKIIQYLNN